MKIFKNSTLDFFLVLYAVIGFLFPFIVSTFNVWVWVLLTPIQVLLVVTALNTSMHYHMHNPLFLNRYLNRFFEIFSSMFTLIPFQLWKYFHVAHHRYNNDIKKNNIVKDPVSFYRYGKNNQRENVWKYICLGMFRDLTGQSILDKNNTCSTKCILQDTSKLKTENLMIVLYLVAIMLFTGWYFVYFIFVAMLISMTNNAESYGEHYNAIDHSNFRCDSVSSYGRLYNFFCFNIGYHQEHHVKPGLHWSRLPEITPTLPEKRTTIDTMYIFNLPYYKDFKELFK